MSTNTIASPGKVAVITGANRGLGLATARHLGQAGVRLLVGSRESSKGEAAAAQLRAEGFDAEALQIDVTSESSVTCAAVAVGKKYPRIDILINNAGILPEATSTDIERPLDLRMFKETFETNVFGAVSVTKRFLPLLRASASGRVVNVSSTVGSLAEQGNPESPYFAMIVPAYQMSKAALNGFTIALSKALADTQIKVNSVCPGWVQTNLGGPDNRAAAPTPVDDAAAVVAKVALADEGSTGQFVDQAGSVAW